MHIVDGNRDRKVQATQETCLEPQDDPTLNFASLLSRPASSRPCPSWMLEELVFPTGVPATDMVVATFLPAHPQGPGSRFT